jgi:hypothetical protein
MHRRPIAGEHGGVVCLRSGQLYLYKRDRNLLLHSEAPKVYPWLQRLLDENETFGPSLVDTLEPDYQRFVRRDLRRLITQASREWRPDKLGEPVVVLEGQQRAACTLCGARCRRICYIVNQISQARINVGVECVKHFMDEYRGMTHGQVVRHMQETHRKAKLNQMFPDLDWEDVIAEWLTALSDRVILGPLDVEDAYVEVRHEAQETYQRYLEHGLTDHEVDAALQSVNCRRLALLNSIDRHIAEHCDEPFVATRAMASWLSEHDPSALGLLRAAGVVTRETVHRIREPQFMKSLQGPLSEILAQSIGFGLVDVRTSQQSYIISAKAEPGLRLEITHERLLSTRLRTLLFEHQDARIEEATRLVLLRVVVSRSRLTQDSVEEALRRVCTRLVGTTIELWDYEVDYNELYCMDQRAGVHVVVPLDAFLEESKGMLFGLADPSADDLVNLARSSKHARHNREEFRDHDRYRAVTRRLPGVSKAYRRAVSW